MSRRSLSVCTSASVVCVVRVVCSAMCNTSRSRPKIRHNITIKDKKNHMLSMNCKSISDIRECSVVISDIMMNVEPTGVEPTKESLTAISNIRECSIVISDIMMEMEPTGKSLAGPRNSEPAAIGRQIVNEITPKKNKNKFADLKVQLSEIKINEEASDNDSETDSEYILSSGEIHPSSSDCSTESDYEEVPVIRKTVCASSRNTCIEPEVNSEFSQINLELSEVNSELSEDRSTYCNQSTSIKDNRGCIPSYVNSSDMKKKKHFCLYCKSLFVNLPRHLETVHFNEEEVKKFVALPKLSQERKFLINELRNKGNFLFNTNPNINNGELIVNRRPAVSRKKSPDDFAPCPKCKGFMVKRTLFQHYRNCCSNTERGTKNILIKSKILNVWCHNLASESLKKNIFPPMRYDAVFSIIWYDYLLIIFGNKLCQIYKTQHFHKYIRQILRTLGRLMISVKQIDNSVIDFALLFTPKKYDTLLEAVNQLASLNPETCSYMKPTLAFNIGTYIKKCANLLITEYIKKEEFDKKSKVEQFLTVLVEDYGVAVNKTALENQVDQRRKKKIQLPHSEDIDKLRNYLENQRIVNFAILCSKFSSAARLSLAKCCFTYIQIFNRRRAGEMERMMINDFAQHHSLDVESMSDLDMNLSAKAKNAARDFVRFQIRGKLARTVSVLVHKNWVDALKLVLKYREEAGVPAENPYIFGIAGGSKFEYNHLKACELLRCFALESGVKYPETIRGTLLRKHIATVVQKLSLSDSDMSFLANFMGHDDKIHKNYYRLPIASKEIGQMSNLLTVIEKGEINKFKGKNLEQVCSEDTKISNTNVEDNAQMELVSEEKLPDDIFSSNSGEAAGSRNSESSAISRQIMNEITPKKNKEKCAGFNKIRRLTWSTPERHTVRSKLSKHFQNDTLPSLEECYNLIRDNEVLSSRTAPQIRLWVFNQKQRAKHESIKISGRTSWTTPQKHALRKYFRQHILEGRTPNNAECHKVLSKHQPELQGRTVPIIKSWVAAEIKRHNNN